MVFKQPALFPCGRQMVVGRADQAGRFVKRAAAVWGLQWSNPQGRVCLPASLRHYSVAYGRTLVRSSLACAQTDSGAGCLKTIGRL